jgi:metal-sulfur cluster biosynthetic enzyme
VVGLARGGARVTTVPLSHPAALTEAVVRAALAEVYDPCSQAWNRPISLPDLGLVRSVTMRDDGQVTVGISLTTPFCTALATIMRAVEVRVGELPGVTGVTVDIDAQTPWSPELMTDQARAALAARRAEDRARAAADPAAPTAGKR